MKKLFATVGLFITGIMLATSVWAKSHNVVLYTAPYCKYCHVEANMLRSMHVPFKEVDVSKVKVPFVRMVPTLNVDGILYPGLLSRKDLERILS